MNLNAFPSEILDNILEKAAELQKKEGVTFTFGLSQPPHSPQRSLQRYLRGPVPPALLKWDAVSSIRLVCRHWHDWGLRYALKDMYVKCWRGSERWCDLSLQRGRLNLLRSIQKYPLRNCPPVAFQLQHVFKHPSEQVPSETPAVTSFRTMEHQTPISHVMLTAF
jgi:hypothetical protein